MKQVSGEKATLSYGTYGWSGEMKGAPFSTITDLCQEKLRRPPDLPSLKVGFLRCLVSDIQCAPLPFDLTASITAQPASVHIHVDTDVDVAVNVDCDIGGRN